ncbi:uncharacterized protein LOC124366156 isoform X5 [Homalodisca vitripennis]|uniref:uncharacterized protein LOC124366156 isoform X5 n=1 Tax=Homalodisca vitripennis TaxID=197043 RepID=UPI001EEBCC6E|nr:uncharacterized protein LOC124366156 isoform X5 [Homalodisca vitripennis]
MDPNDTVPSGAFSEEEKLPEGIDEDANWFSKNLGDESDNTVEHEVLNSEINQDELAVELDGANKEHEKSTEEIMETDSQSELLPEIDSSVKSHQVTPSKKDELTDLKDIAMDSKKHDLSNELKEMFEEKSSDAEELHESTLTAKHSLDTEIIKEDKLKDIVPDDILGKDDSFDELDNDALHQELEAHLSYEKSKELIAELPDTSADLHDEISAPQVEASTDQGETVQELQSEPEESKSLDDLSFESKSESDLLKDLEKSKSDLLKNLSESMGTKEIDEIIDQGMPSEEESSKDMPSDLKEIASSLDDTCVTELKDDIENQLQNITGDTSEEQSNTASEEIVSQVDKSNIELNQENMMVEFTHDGENQVLIQINNEQTDTATEETEKGDSVVMETSDGQTLVFSTHSLEADSSESDMVSQVEGGAEFLQAVTGKLEDVLVPVKEEPLKTEVLSPAQPASPVSQPTTATAAKKEPVKEDSPKCCITTCKSGKSTLRTTYRYFKPPVNKILYKKWEYIFNQARQQISPTSLICELHFRTGLIYKRGVDKNGKVVWALREGALPKLSPSGVLRVAGGVIPPPSTTVQVAKRPEGIVKSPVLKPVATPLTEVKTSPNSSLVNAKPTVSTPKVLGKKILQKPIKTVATKVSSEVTDIGFLYKNPELVKVAQDEIANMDLLVCGECHSVFHILELFQAHKIADNCRGESNFKGNPAEPKPQVWAFLLWKSAQAKVSDVESSWKLYQRWCKMDDLIRNTWIAAGKALQENCSIAALKLVDNPITKNKVGRPPLVRERESDDEDYTTVRKGKKPKIQATMKNTLSEASHEEDLGGAGDASSFVEFEPMEGEDTHVSPAKPMEDAQEEDNTLEELKRATPEMITAEVEIKQEVMSDDEHGENKENDTRQNKEPDEIQNCSKCKLPITNMKGAIFCSTSCYEYFHVECTRLQTVKALSKLGGKKLMWKCDNCQFGDGNTPKRKVKIPGKYVQTAKRVSWKEDQLKSALKAVKGGCPIRKAGRKFRIPESTLRDQMKLIPPVTSEPVKSAVKDLTQKQPEEEEFVVEKIVSRRYNIKKKHFEYLLKWEGYPSEQNTWEPAENLGTCQHLLKAFEEALAKQQAAKQAKAPVIKQETPYKVKPPVIPRKRAEPSTPGPSTPAMTSTGRPVRSSKQKAMDQVKVWCGSIVKPSEDDHVGLKRKASSDSDFEDDEEVVIKRVKIEAESEDSDVDSMKRVEKVAPTPVRGRGRPPGGGAAARLSAQTPKAVVNGDKRDNLAAALGLESDEEDEDDIPPAATSAQKSPVVRKMSSLSAHNQQVLVASAKGVVTVDPKKVPNLSSGVYIMSNKSGIVKVDNDKTLTTLQKSGVLKKPYPMSSKPESPAATQKQSGVVVLPKSEGGTPQQKGVLRKTPIATPTTPSTPNRPAGLLKPLRSGANTRPLGLLKPPVPVNATNTTPATPTVTVSPTTPPPLSPISSPASRPVGLPAGVNAKIQQVVRPRNTIPIRGRPVASPLLKRPVSDSPGLQASVQQKLLIAKKKAETEGGEPGVTLIKPSVSISPVKKSPVDTPVLVKPKIESGTTTTPPLLPPIKSTNKVFAHPLLNRGRGRGGYRGRGRGNSLGQLLQVSQREPPEPIKESKLVESDNLLMEFQEPSDSEESDDGVIDPFPKPDELPPIEPDSPPRPLSLCPLTGKVLCKAEGEKTPEPTPPPSPPAPTPPPAPSPPPASTEPTHILPDMETDEKNELESQESQEAVAVVPPTSVAVTRTIAPSNTTTVVKDGMICKVEMSPGGTTGTLVEAVSVTPPGVTEGTVTIKKPLASRNRLNRGPQLSVMPSNSTSTSLGTITVPARKLFQEESGEDDIVTITGEDGLVYQVSNSELAGNTLLVSEDGQQQCVYVTTDGEGEDGSTILTLDTAYADAVAQLGTDQVNILSTENGEQFYIKEGEEGGQLMALEGEEGVAADDQSGQVVAQLVEAGEPAPGGSRRVVLLLPDGNLMMTEVDEEQYAALDLDK